MPAYEADLERFKGYDAQVLGISVDSVPCNTAWAKSLGGLSYDLLSDFEPKGEVARAYGAYRAADGIFERELSKSNIAIVTAGGVHLRDQEPFNTADELGDLTFRIIPPDAETAQLM